MRTAKLLLIAGAALALAGCAESRLRLSPDFGEAVHQDVMAQTADPDAHYEGVPAAGANGQRAAAAQERYGHDQVIQPAGTNTSSVSGGSGGNGGGGGGGSASPSQ